MNYWSRGHGTALHLRRQSMQAQLLLPRTHQIQFIFGMIINPTPRFMIISGITAYALPINVRIGHDFLAGFAKRARSRV